MIRRLIYSILALIVLFVVYSLLPKPWTNELESRLYWQAFLNNEKGLAAFTSKDLSMATSRWADGLSTSPGLLPLHYNLGVGWQLMNRSDEAVKAYNLLLKSPEAGSVLHFNSDFNMGVLYQTAKDTDKALLNYQAALDINPSSRETKINIELLIQDQKGGGGGQGQKPDKDKDKGDQQNKDDQGKGDKEKDQQDQKKEYAKQPKPEKKQFKSEQLSQSDVNKILGEIKQQEQKIRAEYNKKESKEQPRDKDW